jgi:SP family facilitated glucose transporter-like MFS transporter 8
MERDGVEGLGSATSPLLLAEKITGDSNKPTGDHSITPLLVFSTFVALCGSFSYGCSVSIYIYIVVAKSGFTRAVLFMIN